MRQFRVAARVLRVATLASKAFGRDLRVAALPLATAVRAPVMTALTADASIDSRLADADRTLHALCASGSHVEANAFFDSSLQAVRGLRSAEADAFTVRWSIRLSQFTTDQPCALSDQNVTEGLRLWSEQGVQRLKTADNVLGRHLNAARSPAAAVALATVVCDAVRAYEATKMLPEAFLLVQRALQWFAKCNSVIGITGTMRNRIIALSTPLFQADPTLAKIHESASNGTANRHRLKQIVDKARAIQSLFAGKGAALQQQIARTASASPAEVISAVESQLKQQRLAFVEANQKKKPKPRRRA